MADLLAAVVERHGRGGLRAVLEAPTPNALNGKFSWFGCGFAFGVWSGALRAHGVQAWVPRAGGPCVFYCPPEFGSNAFLGFPAETDMDRMQKQQSHGKGGVWDDQYRTLCACCCLV